MKAPVVSHGSWERVRGFAQIALGTKGVDVGEMAFEAQLVQLMSVLGPDRTFHEAINEMEGNPDEYVYAKWEDGVKVLIRPDERDKPHRPRLSEETAENFTERVMSEYPGMVVGGLAFDKKLQLFLERVETYYGSMDCELVNDGGDLNERGATDRQS